jgi:phenylpropionate dioxygenase-like ring-hydroxylating dioxygenase large terminal subunit
LEQFLGESFPIIEAMWSASATPQFISSGVAANWRLCFQIAVEDYHVPTVHAPVWGRHGYLKREQIGYFRFGRHSAFFTNSDPDAFTKMAAECRAGTWRSANYRVFHIFPNLTVNHFRADGEHWYVMAMQYVPLATNRSMMRAWYYPAPFAASRPWHDRWTRLFMDAIRRVVVRHSAYKVLDQDTAVCEKLQTIAQQLGAAPVLGGLEERLGWFEDAYADAMR